MKVKTRFMCSQCAASFPQWAGQCTQCGAWNAVIEEPTGPSAKPGGRVTQYANQRSIVTAAESVVIDYDIRIDPGL